MTPIGGQVATCGILAHRLRFCDKDLPTATELFSNADDALVERINTNSQHVLQRYLPDSWA